MTDLNSEFQSRPSEQDPFQVRITSNKDVTIAYPELFEPCNIDSFPFQIEKKQKGVDYTEQPRLVLLPSGIVSISCAEDNSKIWGKFNTPQYKNLLSQANKLIATENNKQIHTDTLSISETIDKTSFSINLFPFKDSVSTNILMDMLKTKDLSSKKRAVK